MKYFKRLQKEVILFIDYGASLLIALSLDLVF